MVSRDAAGVRSSLDKRALMPYLRQRAEIIWKLYVASNYLCLCICVFISFLHNSSGYSRFRCWSRLRHCGRNGSIAVQRRLLLLWALSYPLWRSDYVYDYYFGYYECCHNKTIRKFAQPSPPELAVQASAPRQAQSTRTWHQDHCPSMSEQ